MRSDAPPAEANGQVMAQAVEKTTPDVVEKTTAEEENTYHYYTGNAIPWFVRALWILFWCGAIAYVVTWLLPALQTELLAPP